MEPSIRLTAATLDDAEELGRLQVFVHDAHVANVPSYFRGASAEYLGNLMAEKLREADTRGFVARTDNEAAGYILGCVKRRPERELSFAYHSLYIDQIFVKSERRAQGVARALVEAMSPKGFREARLRPATRTNVDAALADMMSQPRNAGSWSNAREKWRLP